MRYWRTDYDIPYPGSEGALVHTGDLARDRTYTHVCTQALRTHMQTHAHADADPFTCRPMHMQTHAHEDTCTCTMHILSAGYAYKQDQYKPHLAVTPVLLINVTTWHIT